MLKKSLADKMTKLMQEERQKSTNKDYISGYVDGVLDMYNLADKHIKEGKDEHINL